MYNLDKDVFCQDYYPVSDAKIEIIKEVKIKAQELYDLMEKFPYCRHASLAKTKLEESIMWFTKGVVKYMEQESVPETSAAFGLGSGD